MGYAMKATYGEVNGVGREIFKDPATDDGTKKSAKGLLRVDLVDGEYVMRDQVTWDEEAGGELKTVFKDSKLYNQTTLAEIRKRIQK
jgi:nicotinamide phosphoribosyltransferase